MIGKAALKGTLFCSVILALCIIAYGTTAQALTSTWNNTGSSTWGTVSNWDVSAVPNASTDDAVFPNIGSSPQISVGSTYDVHDISFTGNTNNNYRFINGQLNLYHSFITTGQQINFNTRLALLNDTSFSLGSGTNLNLAAVDSITGSHGLTLSGGGIINMSGTTTINSGRIGTGGSNNLSPNSQYVLADASTAILSACGGDQTIANLSGGAASKVWFCGARITLGDSTDTTYAGTMLDSGNAGGGITKVGTGKLTLTGTNTYTGETIVNAGILSVNGSLTNSATTVNTAGTLKGTGSLQGVTVNGTAAPGNSIGTLTGTTFEFANGSTLENEIDAAGNTDLVNATTSVTIDAGSTLKILPAAGTYTAGTRYTLISAPSITGSFTNVTGTVAGLTYTLEYSPTHVDLVLASTTGSNTVTVGASAPKTGYGSATQPSVGLFILGVTSVITIAAGVLLLQKKN